MPPLGLHHKSLGVGGRRGNGGEQDPVPNSAWAWNRNGWLGVYLGQPELAMESFNRALRLSPFDPMVFNCRPGYHRLGLYQLEDEPMFSLIKELGVRIAVKQEAIPFLIAFAIAEFFFKFKSFALECLAFLVVWFVSSFVQSLIVPHIKGERSSS